jgi:hypothetical protein
MKLSFLRHRFEVSASRRGGVPQRLPGAHGRQGFLPRTFSGRPHNYARRRRGEPLGIGECP